MNKRKALLIILLIVILLVSAVIYIAGRFGFIGEAAMMLTLLPLMLGVVCLCCILYAEDSSDEKRDR